MKTGRKFLVAAIGLALADSAFAIAASCPAGTFGIGGEEPCFDCSIGFYQAQSGQSSCDIAEAGHFVAVTGATQQLECLPGRFQTSQGSSLCFVANPGNYVPTSAATAQLVCAAGSYEPDAGSSACDIADPGSFVSGTGATAQLACSVGSFQENPGGSDCDLASPGYFVANIGSSQATACAVGSYQSDAGQASCVLAPSGNFVDSIAAISPVACEAGTYQPNIGASSCLIADPGFFVSAAGSGEQVACAVGTFRSNPGGTACDLATPGFFVPVTGASHSTACALGTFQSNSGQSSCVDAPPGNFVAETGSSGALQCEPGSYQPNSGASSCLVADPGSFVNTSGAAAQLACAIGTYQDSAGMTSCNLAAPGYFVETLGASTQTPAPIDFFVSSSGATEAEACPADTVSFGASVTCRSAPADGDKIVSPIFDSSEGRGGSIIHEPTILAPAAGNFELNVQNISNDLGAPDPLTRLTLNSLNGVNFDGEVSSLAFVPGATLDEGENTDLQLLLKAGRLGHLNLRLTINTDESAGLGLDGEQFRFEFEATADGENIATAVLADRPVIAAGDSFSIWLDASNPGYSDAISNELNLLTPPGANCNWTALAESGAAGSGTALTDFGTDTVKLSARTRVLYHGACTTDGDIVESLVFSTEISPDISISDLFANDNDDKTSVDVDDPQVGSDAVLSLETLSQTPFLQAKNPQSVVYHLTNNGPGDVTGGNFAVLVLGAATHISLICSDMGITDCGDMRQVGPQSYAVDTSVDLAMGESLQFTLDLNIRTLKAQHLKIIAVATLPPGSGNPDTAPNVVTITVDGKLFISSFE